MTHDPYFLIGIVFLIVGLILFLLTWTLGWWRDNVDPEENERRKWYQSEINAVIMLEYEGTHCPSTFDGGAYLRQLLSEYRQEGVWG